MGIRGLLFVGIFAVGGLAALAEPFSGIIAYVVHYHTYPENAYWGRGLAAAGVRYSLFITMLLATGTLLNWKRLPYGRLLVRQELIYLAFVGWVLISGLLRPLQVSYFLGVEQHVTDPVEKMLKMSVFILSLTHVVITPPRFDRFAWLLVACAMYLGYEAYTAPASRYVDGRVEGVGGADFQDANAFGAHMAALLPIIGVRFLRGGWKGKAFSLVAGALAFNAIVLTRSRGAFLALAAGLVVTPILAPSGSRRRIWALTAMAVLGATVVVDEGFIRRMGTLDAKGRQEDEAAQSRLRFWGAGLRMAMDHPMGVGPGNFAAHVVDYLPGDEGRDTHNSYIRCLADLGWPGLALFAGTICLAFRSTIRVRRLARGRPELSACAWHGYALQVALIIYLVASIFGSYVFVEMNWWLIMLAPALERACANAGATGTS